VSNLPEPPVGILINNAKVKPTPHYYKHDKSYETILERALKTLISIKALMQNSNVKQKLNLYIYSRLGTKI
jgi:hypothetical protein